MPKWLKIILEATVYWLQRKGYVDPNLHNRKTQEKLEAARKPPSAL